MDGQGTYSFINHDKYTGEWKNDNWHGEGIFIWANGKIEQGNYMNDKFVPTICENMGLTKGSDPFGNCVLELIKEINKEG